MGPVLPLAAAEDVCLLPTYTGLHLSPTVPCVTSCFHLIDPVYTTLAISHSSYLLREAVSARSARCCSCCWSAAGGASKGPSRLNSTASSCSCAAASSCCCSPAKDQRGVAVCLSESTHKPGCVLCWLTWRRAATVKRQHQHSGTLWTQAAELQGGCCRCTGRLTPASTSPSAG
jgi:hypothetical protein